MQSLFLLNKQLESFFFHSWITVHQYFDQYRSFKSKSQPAQIALHACRSLIFLIFLLFLHILSFPFQWVTFHIVWQLLVSWNLIRQIDISKPRSWLLFFRCFAAMRGSVFLHVVDSSVQCETGRLFVFQSFLKRVDIITTIMFSIVL